MKTRKDFEDLLNIKQTFTIVNHVCENGDKFLFNIIKSSLRGKTEINQSCGVYIISYLREEFIDKLINKKEYNILYLLNLFSYTIGPRQKNFKRKLYSFYNFLMKNKDVINENLKLNNITIKCEKNDYRWFIAEDENGQ